VGWEAARETRADGTGVRPVARLRRSNPSLSALLVAAETIAAHRQMARTPPAIRAAGSQRGVEVVSGSSVTARGLYHRHPGKDLAVPPQGEGRRSRGLPPTHAPARVIDP